MNTDANRALGVSLIEAGVRARPITRVLLDYSVTLECWSQGMPTAELKFEAPFEIALPDGARFAVKPERLGDAATEVARLHEAVIAAIAIDPDGVLRLRLADGRSIVAPPLDGYESWSYSSDDGAKAICLPGGHVANWTPSPPRDIR